MTRLRLWPIALVLLWSSAAFGQSGAFWNGGPFGRSYGGGGAIPFSAATAVGTCIDGSVMVDVNGMVRCGADTTTDPSDMIVRGGACYELDATCTAPDVLLSGGLDTKQYTGVTQANCGTDTITVTVVDNTGTSTANALVEGTDWDCLTDDNTCATALAAAIDALSGVSSQASTNTVGVRPGDATIGLTLASSDATCATASNGTDGVVGLPVGQRLVFDADGTANDSIYSSSDGVMRISPDGTIVWTVGSTFARFASNKTLQLGDSSNYWLIYDSGNTQFELNSTDCDTGGTDCVVLTVDDGTDDAVFNGGVTLKVGERLTLDGDATNNDYITVGSDGTIGYYPGNTLVMTQTASLITQRKNTRWIDAIELELGSSGDQHLVYTDGTGVTWSDGTNTVLTVPDDSNQFNLGTNTDLGFGNAETIHNDTDGKFTFGGAGGTNNEVMTVDVETSANQINFESTSGVTTFYFGTSMRSAANITVGSANGFYALSRARLGSPADGQWAGSNNANSTGAVLDFDDAADTVVIKDKAGTGAGDIGLLVGGKFVLDLDADANNYLEAADGTITTIVENGSVARHTASGMYLFDARYLGFGTGAGGVPDQTLTYTDGTGVTWNDGTNTVLTVPDDSNQFNLGTNTDLGFGNAETIHNDTDGKFTFGGAGGTNNENLVLDFETNANQITFTSGTSANVLNATSFAGLFSYIQVNSTNPMRWATRAELYSLDDGQVSITNDAVSSGATLDVDDAADTVVIKDQAGTGAGSIGVLEGGKVIYDANENSDAYHYMVNTNTLRTVVEGAATLDQTSTIIIANQDLRIIDAKDLSFGTGSDQTLTYTDGTGVTWSDGTNTVLTVPDDTGQVTFGGGINLAVVSIDSDDSAYAVPATAHVIVCDPDSGSVPADTTVTLPDSTGGGRTIIVKNIGTTYDCLVDPFDGTDQIDNSGAGTAVTVDTKASLTVIDVGATNFQWIIE